LAQAKSYAFISILSLTMFARMNASERSASRVEMLNTLFSSAGSSSDSTVASRVRSSSDSTVASTIQSVASPVRRGSKGSNSPWASPVRGSKRSDVCQRFLRGACNRKTCKFIHAYIEEEPQTPSLLSLLQEEPQTPSFPLPSLLSSMLAPPSPMTPSCVKPSMMNSIMSSSWRSTPEEQPLQANPFSQNEYSLYPMDQSANNGTTPMNLLASCGSPVFDSTSATPTYPAFAVAYAAKSSLSFDLPSLASMLPPTPTTPSSTLTPFSPQWVLAELAITEEGFVAAQYVCYEE